MGPELRAHCLVEEEHRQHRALSACEDGMILIENVIPTKNVFKAMDNSKRLPGEYLDPLHTVLIFTTKYKNVYDEKPLYTSIWKPHLQC